MLTAFMTARGRMLEQQLPLILVSKQELSACPGGACIGTGSRTVLAPPLAVLFGHLRGQIVLTEPLWIAWFLTVGNAAGKIGLVRITAPFAALGGFLHDDLGMLMVFVGFSGKYRTFSAHHGCRSVPLSYPFRPNWPLR